jgi:hypothetical protein
VFLLNPPSHDAKSGCKGTKNFPIEQIKSKNNVSESKFFTFHFSLFTFFRTFAPDKSIKK